MLILAALLMLWLPCDSQIKPAAIEGYEYDDLYWPIMGGQAGLDLPLFGPGPGGKAKDYSKLGGDCTPAGTLAYKGGQLGTELDFDGSSGYLTASSELSAIQLTDAVGWTVLGCFRADVLDNNWHSICTKRSPSTANRQFFIGTNGGFGPPTNGLSLFTNDSGLGWAGTNALTVGRWYWFLGWHQGTGVGGTGNKLWVWSRENKYEAISYDTSSSSAMDADNGTNPFFIGKFTTASPFLLNGALNNFTFFPFAVANPANFFSEFINHPWSRFSLRQAVVGGSAAAFKAAWAVRASEILAGGLAA